MTPYTAPIDSNLAAGSAPGFTIADIDGLVEFTEEAVQNGPYVYDTNGTLIYSGYGSAGAEFVHDLKVIEYNGQPHLTFFQGNDGIGGARGHGIIMDSTYSVVTSVQPGLGKTGTDVHEFTVLPDGTALTTIFQPTQYDLSAYGVLQPVGWVLQGIFQEIDIQTGEVLFEWQSIEHVDPSESYNYINVTAGDGANATFAWDYFHLNSIEKDVDGNYLISSRYCSTLFKISGTDGSIIWRLNGKQNQFAFIGFNNTFAFQHHARIHSQNSTTTTISLFDNGSDGTNTTSAYSSGQIFVVDNSTFTCTLLNSYHIPPGGVLSTSQGSTQVLDNSNVFMGWGAQPFISEFTSDGTCILNAQFGANTSTLGVSPAMSYRAFKANWTGTPASTPAIWTVANSSQTPTTFYVSWNGATEIASWAFFGGATNGTNSSTSLGTVAKQGFETAFEADAFYAWGYADALDRDGKLLGTSPRQNTYYPGQYEMHNITTSKRGMMDGRAGGRA